jgi:uncharacterized SAM-binding protein YcdF (DUF218 family)
MRSALETAHISTFDRERFQSSGRFGLWSGAMEPMPLVLLGCRVLGPARLSAPAARRAERTLAAFRSGIGTHVLACGGKAWRGVREADALAAYLIERGLPESSIERELESRSTRQNAHHAAALLLPRGVRRVRLVTCDFHMDRATRCFEGAGFTVEPLPALSPAVAMSKTLVREARERACLAVDRVLTRDFTRV